jgi:toxin FitB
MYLIDTNVISELRRPDRADVNVRRWADAAQGPTLFLSVMTVLELQSGAYYMVRRDAQFGTILQTWIDLLVLPSFAGRILPIDTQIALEAARLHTIRTFPERDVFIAATALVHGLTVVTRNLKDFAEAGVRLLNPWEA